MAGCKKNRHASSSQVTDWEHTWDGCSSGNKSRSLSLCDFDTLVVSAHDWCNYQWSCIIQSVCQMKLLHYAKQYIYCRHMKEYNQHLMNYPVDNFDPHQCTIPNMLLHILFQVTLGISTLLMYVPTSLGSAHQAGALTLLSLMILLTHTLRRPSPTLLKSFAAAAKPNWYYTLKIFIQQFPLLTCMGALVSLHPAWLLKLFARKVCCTWIKCPW